MKPLRKIAGFLIILIIGLPLLLGIIWAVGLTKGAVSPEFVSELPQEIIEEVPNLVDEVFEEAKNREVITDVNTRAWLDAAARAGISPREVMIETGLIDWMENELSASLEKIGEILRGEIRIREISINLKPLKVALSDEAIDLYIQEIIEALPPCKDEDLELWQGLSRKDKDLIELPACRPEPSIVKNFLEAERIRRVEEIPDEFTVFENIHALPFGISRFMSLVSYTLFLIPALFILLGAIIASTSPASFFRWFGLSTLIGGFISLVLAFFTKNLALLTIKFPHYSLLETWSMEFQELILEKTEWFIRLIFNRLFSPVMEISGIVCIVGFVIFALSFVMRKNTKKS